MADGVFDYRAIDHLADNLYKIGCDEQAKQLFVLMRQMLVQKLTFSIQGLRSCGIMGLEEWSATSGCEIRRFPRPSPDSAGQYLDEALTPAWRERAAAYHRQSFDLTAVMAPEASIAVYGWVLPENPGKVFDDLFILMNRNDDWMMDDKFWLPMMINRRSFLYLSGDANRMLVDFSDASEFELPEGTAFVGSKPIWGHWIVDFLPRVAVLDQLEDKSRRKVLTGTLNGNQKRCLQMFGVEDDAVIQLPAKPLSFNCYTGRDLAFLEPPSKQAAFQIVRDRVAALDLPNDTPSLVYLSRQHLYPRHRISNGEEVTAFFEGKGFASVAIDRLGFFDQIKVMRNAEVVVCQFGSDIGNLCMCSTATVAVILVSRTYLEKTSIDLQEREAIAFLYSLGLPIVLAYGTLDGAEDSTVRNYLDNLNHYDIVELDRALERAFALARR